MPKTIRKALGDLATSSGVTPEQLAHLDAMTDAEITRAAQEDPDNPELTEAEYRQIDAVKAVRAARERTRLSQAQFAKRYRINLSRLKDWEQGRFMPDTAALAYLRVIEREPDAVDRALAD